MRFLYLIISLWVGMVSAYSVSPAQGSIDSKGTDFWLTFMPNFHQKDKNNKDRNNDSLFIFIASGSPTQGTITYKNRSGNVFQNSFSITDTNQMYTFSVAYSGYELEGRNNSGLSFINNSQVETIAPQSFHITSENEVTVYALSQAIMTSDAFLTLPTDALGTEYYVMSYNSDGAVLANNSLSFQSTPSECAIVATDNNTVIHIIPKASTGAGKSGPRDITLNTGEVYLIQAEVTQFNLRGDLTGTNITSSKPIAVFAGHQRSKIPLENAALLNSRDFLCEQMPPVSTWGKNYFITPYPQSNNVAKIGYDIYRVLASTDNTVISLNGNAITRLNKGEFYQAPLTQAGFISASTPVLVAQFKKTSQDVQSFNDVASDPFMMIIPPREQYLKRYRCTNAQVLNQSASNVTYTEQYMTIIVPKYALDSVKIDGNRIQPFRTDDVPFVPSANFCTPYVYAWLAVADGVHSIEAGVPFGLLVYGYGAANSYGYVGGMALNNDNRTTAVSLGKDTVVCIGNSVQLLASGGNGTYRWSPPQGLSCIDCANPIATPTQTTKYIVRSINDGGCEIADTIEVKVNILTIDAGMDTTICDGDSVTLTPSGGTAYIWSPADGLSCVACNQPVASPNVSTTYYAISTDEFGCIAMDSVTVRVGMPKVDAGKDTSICKGSAVQLQVSKGIYYRWTPAIGLSCTDCQSPIANPSQTTMYYVTVSNSASCSAMDSVLVLVGTPQVDAGNDTVICKNSSAQLRASNGISYSWFPAIGLSCTDCQSPIANPTQTMQYYIAVEVTSGCSSLDSVTVQVQEVIPDAGADTTICYGSSAQLHAAGGTAYKWYPANGLSCTDCASPMASPTQATVYHVLASRNGCMNEDSILVTVNIPTAKAWGDTMICLGVPTQIYSSNGVAYKWSPADGLSCTDCQSPMASPSNATTYVVEVMNTLGCIARDSVKIRVKDCMPKIHTYGSILLCDSAETTIWIQNRENTSTLLKEIRQKNNFSKSDGFTLVTPPLPYLIKAFDSVSITAKFRPTQQRNYTTEYQVFTSNDSLQYIQLDGGGDFANVDLTLEHDSTSAPGNKLFPIKISARCNDWIKAKVKHFTLDFRYTRERILFDSVINIFKKGNVLDDSWSFSARELIEPKDIRVLHIEASGTTPLSSNGVLAEGTIGILLGDSAAFDPILSMDIPERSSCIKYSSSVGSIQLYSCFMAGRFVRFSTTSYSLVAQERTIDYSVGLAGNLRLELYNSLGELVQVLHDGQSSEGTFRLELPEIASGLYAVRMKAGQFTDIKPLMIVR